MFERLSWYDLLEIMGRDEIKKVLSKDIISKLRFAYQKNRYEHMKKLLKRLFRKKRTYSNTEYLIDNVAFGILR